ncbi:agmatine deiminase family protein [Candidatus Neomarinimicrobiota bacterium]
MQYRSIYTIVIIAGLMGSLSAQDTNSIRARAEWEEVSAVVIVWDQFTVGGTKPPYNETPWREKATLAKIAQGSLDEGVQVYVLQGEGENAEQDLEQFGVASPNLVIVPFVANEYQWISGFCRDNGPVNVYTNGVDSLKLAAWADDGTAKLMAELLDLPLIYNDVDGDFYTDGGNFMTDGHGSLLNDTKRLSVVEDSTVHAIYREQLGISRIFDLPPYSIHIDYYMKLIDEETIVVADIPTSNYLPPYDDYFNDNTDIQAAMDTIAKNYLTCYGRPYKFVRITNPPTYSNEIELNFTARTADQTYTNSLIVNGTVFVPMYDTLIGGYTADHAYFDSVALATYREVMPGYNILPVPSMQMAARGGAVHCITTEIGAMEPIFISHAWLPDTLEQAVGPLEISAVIRTFSGIADAQVYVRDDPLGAFQPVTMNTAPGDTFTAYLQSRAPGTQLDYYISATSNNGKTVTKPWVAPEGYFTTRLEEALDISDAGNALPKRLTLLPNWPNPFNPATTISYILPSAQATQLRIYDLLGREIALLVTGVQASGEHHIVWDGRDNKGRDASAGIYLARISVPGNSQTIKMLLVK